MLQKANLILSINPSNVSHHNLKDYEAAINDYLENGLLITVMQNFSKDGSYTGSGEEPMGIFTEYELFNDKNKEILQYFFNCVEIAGAAGLRSYDYVYAVTNSVKTLTKHFNFGYNFDKLKDAGMFEHHDLESAFCYIISYAFKTGKSMRFNLTKDSHLPLVDQMYQEACAQFMDKRLQN